MSDYRFSVLIAMAPGIHEAILEATDALGNAGCTDASIRGHVDGMELLFERTADSLQVAIISATLAQWLTGAGHDVVQVVEEDARMADSDVLQWATREKRIIITTDSTKIRIRRPG